MLGALVDAGVSKEVLQRTAAALNIGAELRLSRVDRSGISATKIDVLVNEAAADQQHSHERLPTRPHPPRRSREPLERLMSG